MLWEQTSVEGYLQVVGVLQKYIDQSISANTSYDPANYANKKLSMTMLLKDLLTSYKLGCKNLYYMNTNDGAGELDASKLDDEKKAVKKGIVIELPPMEEDEDDCDSCKI